MRRVGIIADVHGDVHALRGALDQLDRLGCTPVLCAGDLVGRGLFPEETVALLRERGIPCIRGNHDRWAARDASGSGLTKDAVSFLAALPVSLETAIDGVRLAVWHGTPASDLDCLDPVEARAGDIRRWLDRLGADVLVVGHTHVPFRLEIPGRGVAVNPGALLRDAADPAEAAAHGFPGAAPSSGTFGILELPSMQFMVHSASGGAEVDILRRRL